jgi:anti-sigma B factor antagonist
MSPPGFSVEVVRDEQPTAVVSVTGEVDLATAPELGAALDRVGQGSERQVHLDLERVTFLDSSGISVLVETQRRLASGGGRLVLHRATGPIVRVLEISGLGSFFELSEHAPV